MNRTTSAIILAATLGFAGSALAAQVHIDLASAQQIEATLRDLTSRTGDEKAVNPPLKYDLSISARWKMAKEIRVLHQIADDANAALAGSRAAYQRAQMAVNELQRKVHPTVPPPAPGQAPPTMPVVDSALEAQLGAAQADLEKIVSDLNKDYAVINQKQKDAATEIDLLNADDLNLAKNNIAGGDIANLALIMDSKAPTDAPATPAPEKPK